MPDNITVRCKLEAKDTDPMGYTTYVFACKDGSYVMCTRYPNWDHKDIAIGEDGFLEFQEIEAGKTYFCSRTKEERIYNYDKVQFIKFVPIAKPARKGKVASSKKVSRKRKIPLLIEQDNELL